MKKKLLFINIIMYIILISGCSGQKEAAEKLSVENTYETDEEMYENTDTDESTTKNKQNTYTLETKKTNKDGEEEYSYITYIEDSNGNITREINASDKYEKRFEYDVNGRVIKEEVYYSDEAMPDDTYIYVYDNYGNNVKVNYYFKENLADTYEYEYDAYGNVEKEIYTAFTPTEYSSTIDYNLEYDTSGNITKKKVRQVAGNNTISNCVYEYDDAGRVIKEYDPDNISDCTVYEYTFSFEHIEE